MSIITCGPACTFEIKNSYKPCGDPQESYVGLVLETYERNGYNDSDFYALVWDEENQRVTSVEYASTRGWTYHNSAHPDATPEVLAKATEYYRMKLADRKVSEAHRMALVPSKGKTVKSTTTRGKNVGVTGVVKWIGENHYRSSRWDTVKRLGIKVEGEDKLRYLDDDKVSVVDPEPVNEDAIRQSCMNAEPANWRSAQYAITGIC